MGLRACRGCRDGFRRKIGKVWDCVEGLRRARKGSGRVKNRILGASRGGV